MKANLLFFLLKCSLCPIYKIFWLLQGCRLSHIFSPRSGIDFTYLGFPISLIVHFKLLFFFFTWYKVQVSFFSILIPSSSTICWKVLFSSIELFGTFVQNCMTVYICVCACVCVCVYRERESISVPLSVCLSLCQQQILLIIVTF